MISVTRNPLVLWCALLAALWLPVVYLLGAQWTFYEQYHYGWAVPFACVFFAWRRARLLPAPENGRRSAGAVFLLCVAGLVYWFSRVLQEANPLWRAASYGLAISAGAITLLFLYFAGGERWVKRLLFPAAFLLISVPWPTRLEGALIQALTRLDTSVVVEILGFFGIPALMHGDVIELTHGAVGVEEACSGIRSLQATLMITLFFGEFFQFNLKRRTMLLAGGTFLAVILNVCRTFFLAWVAARFGDAVMEKWHDPAGVFAFACFVATWLLALFLRGQAKPKEQGMNTRETSAGGLWSGGIPYLSRMAITVIVCVAFIEISTEAWFRAHEKRGQSVKWSARWPEENPSYQSQPVSADVREIMRFDESAEADWTDANGRDWKGFYFRWFPATTVYGRMKVALAKRHTPDVCLQAHGWRLRSELAARTVPVGQGLNLPFRRFMFEQDGQTLYVFFAVVEDRLDAGAPGVPGFSHWDRIRAAVDGSRNFGERSVEVAATGFNSSDEAWQAFQTALPGWIKQNGADVSPATIAQNQ